MTDLLYLQNTYNLNDEALVVGDQRDERGRYLLLDRTIFYPQGGGQPSDTGIIKIEDAQINVESVTFVDGAVRHYIEDVAFVDDLVGQFAGLAVNESKRLTHARYHTAGHLITHVLEELNSGMNAIKGYHFENGPYVEFATNFALDGDDLVRRANINIDFAIKNNLQCLMMMSTKDEVSKVRPLLSNFIPDNKPVRLVQIGDFKPLPCGGTHVAHLCEIGELSVSRIKNSKGNIRVSYAVKDATSRTKDVG